MPTLHIKASAVIPAPAQLAYGLIADYTKGHPSILPEQYFQNLEVESGGYGAGTTIRFTVIAYGSRQQCRARVTEPEPGHVLVETDAATGTPTRFIVDPLEANTCRVTFETDYYAKGLRGLIEMFLVPRYLAKAYAAELKQLAQIAGKAHSSA